MRMEGIAGRSERERDKEEEKKGVTRFLLLGPLCSCRQVTSVPLIAFPWLKYSWARRSPPLGCPGKMSSKRGASQEHINANFLKKHTCRSYHFNIMGKGN